MFYLSVFLILMSLSLGSFTVHGDPLADLCRHDIRQQTMTRARQKMPKMTSQEAEKAMDGGIPSAEYVTQSDTAVCIADKMKLALDKPSNFENYCFMSRAKTRVECLQHWMKKQNIAYAKQVVVLAQTGMALAKKDISASPDGAGRVMAAAVDLWLTELERYSLTNNAAFKSGTNQDRSRLQHLELDDYAKVHRIVLGMAEREVRSMNSILQRVPKNADPRLLAAKAKLAQFENRIAKLKQARREVASR